MTTEGIGGGVATDAADENIDAILDGQTDTEEAPGEAVAAAVQAAQYARIDELRDLLDTGELTQAPLPHRWFSFKVSVGELPPPCFIPTHPPPARKSERS